MDGWVGGLLDNCVGDESIIVTVGFVLVFLVVEVGPAAVADCCGGCFTCFFDIGIGEITRLFLRFVHDVVVDGVLFDFAFDLCLGISCFGFCLVILPP